MLKFSNTRLFILITIFTCTVSVEVLQRRYWLLPKYNVDKNVSSDIAKIQVSIGNKGYSGYNNESYNNYRGKPDAYLEEGSSPSSEEESTFQPIFSIRPQASPNDINSYLANPPPHEEVAKMARYVVRNSMWGSMATVSNRDPIKTFPFANIVSLSDGPTTNSTGVPYTFGNVCNRFKNSRCSLVMSLAQIEDYCRKKGFDPEDPRCSRVILSGKIVKLANSSAEAQFAQKALFSRHPVMKTWPSDHGWFFAKLDIGNVLVLDYFGGVKTVQLNEYFDAPA